MAGYSVGPNFSQTIQNRIDNIKNRMIAIPIPFKATPTQLQLELNAVGGNLTGHHILYYERVVQN